MSELLVLVVVAVVVVGAATAIRAALGRGNRVVRGVASPAPLRWRMSSRREAVYHRRLRTMGRRLEELPATEATAEVRDGVRTELLDLDAYLPVVARRPAATRRADRKAVSERIRALDELLRRMEERARREPVSLDELRRRLDHLEAADDELRELGPG